MSAARLSDESVHWGLGLVDDRRLIPTHLTHQVLPFGLKKIYSLKDLKTIGFEDTQKKYNEFATILRQHNVSGHENAFDKLVNIF